MSIIPIEIKQNIASSSADRRKQAAKGLKFCASPEAINALTTFLSDESAEVVYAAKRSLISVGNYDVVEQLIPLLRSEDTRLRNLVIEIISQIGQVAVPIVTELLDDGDKEIRKFAVDILLGIGSQDAEHPLIRALANDDLNVSAAAAEALGVVGGTASTPHLVAALNRHPWVRCATIRSLGKIGGEEALDALLSISPESESIVLYCLVNAIGHIGSARGIDILLKILEQDNIHLEPLVLESLSLILRNSDNDSLERVRRSLPASRIASFLKSANPSAVKTAIDLLGRYADSTLAPELARLYTQSNERLFEDLEKSLLNIKPTDIKPFLDILNDQNEPVNVKVHVAQLLGKIADGSAFESLYSFANTESDELKIEIIMALSVIDMQRSLPILHYMIHDSRQEIKAEIIEIIRTLRDPSSVIILLGLSTDPSPSARSAAATSLWNFDLSGVIPEIEALLKSSDNMEVIFALEAIHGELLGRFGEVILSSCVDQNVALRKIAVRKAGLLRDDRAYQTLIKSLSDLDSSVRLAAIRALENYQDRNLGDCLIVSALSDPEDWNRYEAAKMIGKIKAIGLAPKLVAALDDAPDLVKVAILEVLGELRLKEYKELVGNFTHSESAPVSEAAIEALEKLES